jgi:beta-glucosidase
MSGSAVIMETWREKVPAILVLWYPGMEGGHALADIILGRVNPSGRLPCIFPRSESDLPYFDKDADEIEYGLLHGYRLLEKEGAEAAFPFGFGLSYTSFAYGVLRLEAEELTEDDVIRASVEVANAEACSGTEVVQLYVSAKQSQVERPVKEVKAFRRVGLQPGDMEHVSLEVPAQDLAYYDEDASSWVVEPGAYEVIVARNSEDAKALRARFRIWT